MYFAAEGRAGKAELVRIVSPAEPQIDGKQPNVL